MRWALVLTTAGLALGCGASGRGAREGASAGVLSPASFTLTLRGMEITLDETGAVHAPDCDAHLDFATATLTGEGGAVLSRLTGDAWPRALVVGEGEPPVRVSEREVVAGDRTLFSVADDGHLLDAGGGTTEPPDIATVGLDAGEETTALALLALVSACWED